MRTPEERKDYLTQMFNFFGFSEKFDEVMRAQSLQWKEFFERAGCVEHPDLAMKYREQFYTVKCRDPYRLYALFVQFVQEHQHIHREYFSVQEPASGCDICEGHGTLIAPMIRKGGEITDRCFRCVCDLGKVKYGGLPEATSTIIRWRRDENRREEQRAYEYLRRLDIDPDRPIQFKQLISALTSHN